MCNIGISNTLKVIHKVLEIFWQIINACSLLLIVFSLYSDVLSFSSSSSRYILIFKGVL